MDDNRDDLYTTGTAAPGEGPLAEDAAHGERPATPPGLPERAPAAKRRRRPIGLEVALISVSLAIIFLLAALLGAVVGAGRGLGSLFSAPARNNTPPAGSYSVLYVVGTIQDASGGALGINEPSYHHRDTVNYIKSLADNENDKGILLYMNTGGGGVYESDEVYRALEEYKEKTGRPVWAYMAATCASGGYYICMAAQHITANYNTTTGSIGVYIALTDTSALYEKLGIETVLVRSGENKGVGTSGVEITDGQRAVYQSIVDESYDRFVSLVAAGRGMSEAAVRPIADGRPYTANQALALGLVDELADWDTARAAFEEHTGATAHYPNFSGKTLLGSLLGGLEDTLPKSETETLLELAENLPQGVPMAYAPGLW